VLKSSEGDEHRLGLLFGLVTFAVGGKYSDHLEVDALDKNMFADGIFFLFKQHLAHPGTDDGNLAPVAHVQMIDKSAGFDLQELDQAILGIITVDAESAVL